MIKCLLCDWRGGGTVLHSSLDWSRILASELINYKYESEIESREA